MTEGWVLRLKAGYDAGYYRTEAAVGSQLGFPWQNKTCKDCPFWMNSVCRVRGAQRMPSAHTCIYFDPANHKEAEQLMQRRLAEIRSRWWGWRDREGR